MIKQQEAIVLSKKLYGETSCIYSLWGSNSGPLTVFQKGARRKGKTIVHQAQHIQISYQEAKEEGQMNFLKSATVINPFANIHFNPIQSSITIFLLEFCEKAMQSGSVNEEIFTALHQALININECHSTDTHFHFIRKVLNIVGSSPDFRNNNPYFHPNEGVFETNPGEWSKEKSLLFRMWLSGNIESLSRKEKKNLLELILIYCENQEFTVAKMKSTPVLEAYFKY